MIHPTLKKLALIVISFISLYFSGLNLITMSGVEYLTDAFNVMTFFTYFFPLLFLSANLFSEMFKAFFKGTKFEMPYFKFVNPSYIVN
ncbi:MAG: hypothetical protein ACI8QP_001693 [Porticoccaceae bacterium]|jgi:hypothetical protein